MSIPFSHLMESYLVVGVKDLNEVEGLRLMNGLRSSSRLKFNSRPESPEENASPSRSASVVRQIGQASGNDPPRSHVGGCRSVQISNGRATRQLCLAQGD